ncbi:hypothetical protein ACHAWF_017679 [Thalassiosira exigua]
MPPPPPEAADSEPPPPAPPPGHELVTEGPVTMLYPASENSVFYNPVQVQNRDLSVLMLGMYAERRAERSWTTARRKELRREMLAKEEEEEAGGKEGTKSRTKEERKARREAFERALDARVAEERSKVDFAKAARESSEADGGMAVFEALAASGLRSLRYWKEVPGVRTVVVNDLDPVAVDMARENVRRNGLEGDLASEEEDERGGGAKEEEPAGAEGATSSRRLRGFLLLRAAASLQCPRPPPDQRNATQRRFQRPQFDVIDLDPYGSAAPFLDAAVQSVASGGLLAITCTDMAALGGSHPETCYGRYGAFPIQRAGYLQELALRILLYHVSVVAGRYGRTMRPILSVGMHFYCRVFVEVRDDKAGVNNLSLNHGHLFQSTRCSSFHVTPVATNDFVAAQEEQRRKQDNGSGDGGGGGGGGGSEDGGGSGKRGGKRGKEKKPSNVYRNGRGPCGLGEPTCGETGAPYKVAGPLWTGPLHDPTVVEDAVLRLEAAMADGGACPNGGTPTHPLKTAATLHGLLVACSEELPDAPLYHLLPTLCSAVNSPTIPTASFRAALVNAGYRVSAYHKEPNAIKTDAPNRAVWDVVRAWCKEHPPAKRKESKRHRKGEAQGSNAPCNDKQYVDVADMILSKEIRTEVDFNIPKGIDEGRRKAKRWALNPEAHWGPKKAASGKNKRGSSPMRDNEPDAKQRKSEA